MSTETFLTIALGVAISGVVGLAYVAAFSYEEAHRLHRKLHDVVNVGHNDDCMFCGFKDKVAACDWKRRS